MSDRARTVPESQKAVAEALAFARESLTAFGAYMVSSFEPAPHVRKVAELLEAMERGEVRRAIVNLPPRHGKSLLCSVLFPLWLMGRDPKRSSIVASYGETLSIDHGRLARNLSAEPDYRALFGPEAALADDSSSAGRFHNRAGGSAFYVSTGSSVTGRGSDLFVIDDVLKDIAEARSRTVKDSIAEWFRYVALTRLSPQGRVLIASTRWATDDLPGRVMEEDPKAWHRLVLPALSDGEGDPLGRPEGAPLWERYGVEELANIRQSIGARAWESLYMQRPAPQEGAIFRREWFNTFPAGASFRYRSVVQSWDTAFGKDADRGDFSACATIAASEDGFRVLHVLRARLAFPDLKHHMIEMARQWRPSAVIVEDSASGQSALQELRKESRLPLIPVKPQGPKEVRWEAVSPLFESGRVLFPAGAAWLDETLEELASVPAARHDDVTDALCQGLSYLRHQASGPWTFVRVGSTRGRAAFDDDGRATRGYFEQSPEQMDAEDDMQDSDPFWSGRGAY
jgi:predicted phage terminase large subunit-like protein